MSRRLKKQIGENIVNVPCALKFEPTIGEELDFALRKL
jgi:hypothetical protein